jgi:hypothetical protein
MNITIYDPTFEPVTIFDTYESFIWTDRYNEPGDFEIYTVLKPEYLSFFKRDYYVEIEDSEHMMIIENIETETDAESGNHLRISGRSLESILDRRIVWNQTNIEGSLEKGIRQLLTENIIAPEIKERQIENFIFEDSTDIRVTDLNMENQYTGDTLLEVIEDVCKDNDIGFKICLNDNNQFVFSLYAGVDRSYEQDVNEYVVFKPSYDNVISSNYKEEGESFKNVCLVVGDDRNFDADAQDETLIINEDDKVKIARVVGYASGLSRRELYSNASGINKDEDMSEDEYKAKLDQHGTEELNKHMIKKTFDGQYETTKMFVYKRDFFIGDIVQVSDGFGNEAPSRILEFIWSHSASGFEAYPTFKGYDSSEEYD